MGVQYVYMLNISYVVYSYVGTWKACMEETYIHVTSKAPTPTCYILCYYYTLRTYK
jgi:hypothetical protein